MDRIRNRLALAVAIAAALFLPCGPATAQGTLNTYACENFPAALQVRVDLLDDAEPMLRVRAALLAALARKGIPVADGAPYVLSVGAEATRLAARRKGRDLGSISEGPVGGRGTNGTDPGRRHRWQWRPPRFRTLLSGTRRGGGIGRRQRECLGEQLVGP